MATPTATMTTTTTTTTTTEASGAESSTVPHGETATEDSRVTVYCCQRCRCALFSREQLSSQHETGQHAFGYFKRVKDSAGGGKECSSLFLSEPNQWMSALAMAEEAVGKLNCPKCGHRVGSFAWAGSQCSCGTWIVPAIQVPVSKVDPREIPRATIPDHCADLQLPTDDMAALDLGEKNEDEPDGEHVDGEEDAEAATQAAAPRDPREVAHEAWLEHINQGAVEDALALVDAADCSMMTVQKKIFDGKTKVSKVIGASTAKLKGRIVVVPPGAVAMPSPSLATRIIFAVEGIEGRFGEAISWAPDASPPQVQHIMRVKDPSDAYLHGQR